MSAQLTEAVFDLYTQRPRAVLLMSGSGTNAEAILSDEELRDMYDISTIVSDNDKSNARLLADSYKVGLLQVHATDFSDYQERQHYFLSLKKLLGEQGVKAAIYAGFMKISTQEFCETFPGVNVHPADLTLLDDNGIAKYRGMNAMSDMRRDFGFVRSTVHVVDCPVDTGSAISVSEVVVPHPSETDSELHARLKDMEHAIYTSTLRALGRAEIQLADLPIQGPLLHGEDDE